MNIDDLKELSDALNIGKESQTGFIMIPNIGGFQMFEISKDRLELYLKTEALYKIHETKTKESKLSR